METGPKSQVADQLLHRSGLVSVQVLNEFTSTIRKKLGMDWQEIKRLLTLAQLFCGEPLPLTLGTHHRATDIAERYRFTIYDATIIASALLAGCTTLYTEDMQDGQKIESLSIRNPFNALV